METLMFIRYCHAHTKEQAFVLMCRQIAKAQGVNPSVTINYFRGKADSYSITIETLYSETEEV
jgi:hypothetical protein